MASVVGDRLRLVVKVLGSLVVDEVEQTARLRRRSKRDEPPPAEAAQASAGAEQRRARAVRRALESLGPFYVKLGQILSSRPDMVPQTIRDELQNLHDQVDVQPFSVFEPVLAGDLGPDWKLRFDDIDTTAPLGAASLAQVYRVTLPGGRPAVVKIQRPGIREGVLADMALMRRASRIVARVAPRFNEVIDIEAMLGSVFDAMEPELDFTGEARNMDEARENIRPFRTLQVPRVLHASGRVLVQSLAPGTSVRHIDRGHFTDDERIEIGKDLLRFMYRGYFVHRVFHADPHAGNVFAAPGGPATLIDWGMVGRLDRRTSLQLLPLFMTLAQNDGAGLAHHWAGMGRMTAWSDMPAFAADMAAFVPKVSHLSLEDLNFGVSLTTVLAKATKRGIGSPPSVSLLGKSFANLDGSVRYLAPEITLPEVFQGEVPKILFELGREFLGRHQFARNSMELLLTAVTSPEQCRGVLADIANRQFALNVHEPRTSAAAGGQRSMRPSGGLLALAALALVVGRRRSG
ncbi:ATP/GTP-binding protein [Streptomyces sp. AS58]|uniref:AarF/ABC1/UbiB kinase family protein n=1 Tax=Streptomyces cadmiisoli TaxID=2184053 RepID=A0A2Z4J6H3_9ACTN|nr:MULTISPECIES: AarF/UbiB family protein [Streptomyces]AWW40842.1 AarF/ABC1/UbiB kinase family protein [Streptomyces cadmiisoli]KOV70473.1 ATP/GTP-binding protein [Streptomyces sp. AS58]